MLSQFLVMSDECFQFLVVRRLFSDGARGWVCLVLPQLGFIIRSFAAANPHLGHTPLLKNAEISGRARLRTKALPIVIVPDTGRASLPGYRGGEQRREHQDTGSHTVDCAAQIVKNA